MPPKFVKTIREEPAHPSGPSGHLPLERGGVKWTRWTGKIDVVLS